MGTVRLLLVAVLLFASIPALPGCAAGGSEIDNTSWVLESHGPPDNLTPVIEGTKVSLAFVRSGHGVVGSTGRNAFNGTYEVEGNALTINYEIGPGQRCDLSAIVEQEQVFLSTFVNAESFTIDGDTLTINCGDRVLVFVRR